MDIGLLLSPKSECQNLLVIRLLKRHNIGTHLEGIETSFQVVPLFLKSVHFWVNYITFWNFLKIPSVFKGIRTHCYVINTYFRHEFQLDHVGGPTSTGNIIN
jgi:hypothetical protein